MSTEHLHNHEAVEKLKEMVDKIDIGMLCTYIKDEDFVHSVPMSRQEVDEAGNIWFLFSSESESHRNLMQNDKVTLLYADIESYNFLSLNGIGEMSRDRSRVEKYWNKMVEGWFEKGIEDPRIRILKVTPSEAHYWDNKTNKLVTFFKVIASAASGEKLDIGRQGDLSL